MHLIEDYFVEARSVFNEAYPLVLKLPPTHLRASSLQYKLEVTEFSDGNIKEALWVSPIIFAIRSDCTQRSS